MTQSSCPYLIAFDPCGQEVQGPNMLTRTKRLIPSRDVDAELLGRDALRYHGWDADAVRLRYTALDRKTSYELEVVLACERSQARTLALVVGGMDLAPAIKLTP